MKAYPQRVRKDEPWYRIVGPQHVIRDACVAGGGYWSGTHWMVPEALARSLNADIMVRVRIKPFCHEAEPTEIWVTEAEFKRGRSDRVECPICDKPNSVSIIGSV